MIAICELLDHFAMGFFTDRNGVAFMSFFRNCSSVLESYPLIICFQFPIAAIEKI